MNTGKRMDNRQRNKISLSLQSKIQSENQKPTTKNRIGLTLIEVMVVVLIIAVAVIGAMSFRLYCVTDAKKADVQVNAARIGSMILENWKGTGGLSTYNPTSQFATLFSSQYTITGPTGGSYTVVDKANNVYYYVAMSYQTEAIVIPAGVTVNVPVLNVAILWNQKYDDKSTTARVLSMTAYAD